MFIADLEGLSAGTHALSLALVDEAAGLRSEVEADAHALHLRLCRSGDVHLHTELGAWPLRPAATAFVPAGTVVNWRIGVSCRRLSLRIPPQALVELARDTGVEPNPGPMREPAHDPAIEHYAALIQHEAARVGRLGAAFLDPIARLLGMHVLRAYLSAAPARAASSGLSHAERAHRGLHLPDLAESDRDRGTGGGLRSDAGLLKRALGVSPLQYVQTVRIDLAKKPLRESDLPLTDIALELGFSSQSHFTTVFRSMTGHTPKTFCERHELL